MLDLRAVLLYYFTLRNNREQKRFLVLNIALKIVKQVYCKNAVIINKLCEYFIKYANWLKVPVKRSDLK